MLNVCVVRGECSAPPEVRTLPSGSRLATLAVRTRSGPGAATSVPVAVWEPAAWLEELAAGDEVVVVGRVERRFFRPPGGGAGSRVEVHAEVVARAGDRRRVASAQRRAERALGAIGG